MQTNFLKKIFRILAKLAISLLVLGLLLYFIAAIYVSANKKRVTEMVMAELNKKVSGNISIKEADINFFAYFPQIGISLKEVLITDSLYTQHNKALLQAKELNARVSAFNLIRKKNPLTGLAVKNATIYLFTDSAGYSNINIIKKEQPKPSSDQKVADDFFENVSLKNVKLIIDNKKRQKLYEFMMNEFNVKSSSFGNSSFFKTKASINIGQLGFNLRKGGYLRNTTFKGNFELQLKNNHLLFDSINIKLDGHPFNLSGDFDLGSQAPQFSLHIHTKNVPYKKVLSFLPKKLAKSIQIIEVEKNLDASASIIGPLKGGEPLININWTAENVGILSSFMDLQNASFTGSYTNEMLKGVERGDSNSLITANAFKAKWHGLPVNINKLRVINLENPVLTADMSSSFSLTQLNELLQSNALDLKSGNANVYLQYSGPVVRSAEFNSLINGYIQFDNGKVLYSPRNVELTNVKGKMRFEKSDLYVDTLQCNVFKTSVVMNGTGKQLLSLINTNPNHAIIDWNIFMQSLNLDQLLFLLQQKSSGTTKKKAAGIAGVANKIDRLLEESILNVAFHSNLVKYKNFNATNLQTNISLLRDRYNIQNASMNHAGGQMQLSGNLVQQGNNSNLLKFKSNFNNVDISTVMNAFDNFGQDGITASNIDGKLTAQVNGNMIIAAAGIVLPQSINSDVVFSLKNGTLKNFEPIKKIQNYIFKKRDFDNISFAELKNKLYINNREVTISRMEIQSSVLSMFVEGLYSMRGNTDISIQIPLSNLKKRREEYKPENIGTNKKTGSSIYLRGRQGDDGSIKFSLDLFKKFYKDKKSEE